MKRSRWALVLLIMPAILFAGCLGSSEAGETDPPAVVESIEGSELPSLTLTERAIERLGIQTSKVRDEDMAGSPDEPTLRRVAPYAAVIYLPDGSTWVYTRVEPLVFVRHSITIDYIEGDLAVLSDGPPSGTDVVTTGAVELYGTEFGK